MKQTQVWGPYKCALIAAPLLLLRVCRNRGAPQQSPSSRFYCGAPLFWCRSSRYCGVLGIDHAKVVIACFSLVCTSLFLIKNSFFIVAFSRFFYCGGRSCLPNWLLKHCRSCRRSSPFVAAIEALLYDRFLLSFKFPFSKE